MLSKFILGYMCICVSVVPVNYIYILHHDLCFVLKLHKMIDPPVMLAQAIT